jgi:hypothetical protein
MKPNQKVHCVFIQKKVCSNAVYCAAHPWLKQRKRTRTTRQGWHNQTLLFPLALQCLVYYECHQVQYRHFDLAGYWRGGAVHHPEG